MKHRIQIITTFLCLFLSWNVMAEEYELISPDMQLKVKLQVNQGTQYEVWHGEKQLIAPSPIALNLQTGFVVGAGTVKDIDRNSVNDIIEVPIGKNKTLTDSYNELIIHYNENYDLIFRVYNEGAAYRFQTNLGDEIIVKTEDAIFNFVGNPSVYYPEVPEFDANSANPTLNHWEKSYKIYTTIGEMKDKNLAVTPVLFVFPETNYKVALLESGLLDYPAMYIQKDASSSMRGYWGCYPETVKEPDNIYSNHDPITRYDYIARTSGTRAFPWRVMVVSSEDEQLLNNELVYKLAEPCRLSDISWIVPGKTAWEWGHKAILTADGKADPSRGIPANGGGAKNLSLDLYKYYVDFAARNNIEYMTLDAGWNAKSGELWTLCRYAKTKKVKIIVWCWASLVLEDPNYLNNMKNSEVSGLKVDFVNRSDQPATNWLETIAKRCAEKKMVIMFHGCPVPTGLSRTYPNILNYEAVRGEENNYWDNTSNPDYELEVPFIRMLAGPFDYTPGSMHNVTKGQFRPIDSGETVPGTIPNKMGTRAHELAMYVTFDQPLGYLVDSPTEYEKYPDIMEYFKKVPTVWDKTIPLSAELGKYTVIAKQTKDNFYVAGLNNWSRREVDVDFSFLPEGKEYEAYILRDSISSSNSYPKRYTCETIQVNKQTLKTFWMADGGGFTMRIYPKNDTSINSSKIGSSLVSVDLLDRKLKITTDENLLSVVVYNISGQVVLNKQSGNENLNLIDISNLSKGVYIVNLIAFSGVESFKIIF